MIKYDVFLCCYFFCIGTSFQKIYYNNELNNSCLFQSILKLFRVTRMYHANEYTWNWRGLISLLLRVMYERKAFSALLMGDDHINI